MEKFLRNKATIAVFVVPALIVYAVFVIIPILGSSWYSLLKWDGVGKSTFIGFDNFVKIVFNDTHGFWRSVGNSMLLAALALLIQLPSAMVLALILARGVRGEQFFRKLYFLPMVLSSVVICQLWKQIYHLDYGLLNMMLRGLGLGELAQPWLSQASTALIAVLLPIVWQFIGYHMLLYYSAIKSIPAEIYESARIDGASFLQTAFLISIPLLRPIIRISIIFAVIGSFKLFDQIFIMTGGGPMQSTEVPTTLMYKSLFRKYEYGYGSAISVFILLECLVFTWIVQRLLRSKE